MKIVINADDLGRNLDVNDAVFELMALGRVTSATVLANAEALEHAAARCRSLPSCSFGVHLNASQWRPLTRNPGLRPILDEKGDFAGNRLREIKIDSGLRSALFEEWCAQVERVMAAGFEVSHFDSHHHMHTVPELFLVLKQLQRRYGVRRVRASKNFFAPHEPVSRKRLLAKWLWNHAVRHYIPTATTEGFTSLASFLGGARQKPPHFKSLELMVHPGDPACAAETDMLKTEWQRDLPFPIKLVSYHEIN